MSELFFKVDNADGKLRGTTYGKNRVSKNGSSEESWTLENSTIPMLSFLIIRPISSGNERF